VRDPESGMAASSSCWKIPAILKATPLRTLTTCIFQLCSLDVIQWKHLKRGIASLLDRVILMIVGAWILLKYIDLTNATLGKSLDDTEQAITLAFWLSLLSLTFLRPNINSERIKEPSPRWSGSALVLLTGFAAAYFVGMGAPENKVTWVGAITLVTLTVAAVAWRFATIHADDIGEATFKSPPTGSASNVR
jgi:hypothetical protein